MYATPNEIDADVIIIGGGISGMSAAYYILQCEPSIDLLILEASNFVGGRTLTLPLKTTRAHSMRSFDLGGQFISTPQPFLQNLMKNLELEVESPKTEKDDEKIILDLDPNSQNFLSLALSDFTKTTEWLEVEIFFKKINTMCVNVTFNEPHTTEHSLKLDFTSMEEFIIFHLANPFSQNFIRYVVQISCGLETSQISVLFYLAYCNATGGMQHQAYLNTADVTWIKGGADQICNKIALLIGKQYIKTNRAVTGITWDSAQVIIQTENNIYRARYVILAIPPASILKINFNPPLRENRFNVLKNMNSGNLIKFFVTYETEFWRQTGYNGTVISSGKIDSGNYVLWCFDVSQSNSPTLCGYFSSNHSQCKTQSSYKDQVLTDLARYFGSDALNPVDYLEKNWASDKNPYVTGGFTSVPKFGEMNDYSVLKRPLGNLFWAGTEMFTCWNGHMEGAVQSGYRAASEILYHLRPQNIMFHEVQEITQPYDQKDNTTSFADCEIFQFSRG